MRIVIDMQGAQTESRYRGIGRYTMSFAKAIIINKGEHEIILALNGLFPDTIKPIRTVFDHLLPQENIRVWYAPSPVKECEPGNIWRREVAERIRETFLASLNPDIVLISSLFEGFVDNAVTSVGAFTDKVPTAVILYDLIPLLNKEFYLENNPSYAEYYHRKVNYLKKADLWLSISDSAALEGQNLLALPSKKVINISTACDSIFKPLTFSEEEQLLFPDSLAINKPYILYSGSAEPRKNLDHLIRAYASMPFELKEKHQLVLVGKVSEGNSNHLRQVARNAGIKEEQLVITGYITDEQLTRLYNLCSLFVLPLLHEGFGLPALEALACGAVVIGSNVTSIPEVIGIDEALFNPYDETDICKKMIKALTDKEFRERMIEHGRNQVKLFSWDVTARNALVVIEKSIHDKGKLSDQPHYKDHYKKHYNNLIAQIAVIMKNVIIVNDNDFKNIAACLAKNERNYSKSNLSNILKDPIKWRIEGPFDSSYSLALLNRETALALDKMGHTVILHSTEGPGDFLPNSTFLKDNPDIERLYNRSLEDTQSDYDVLSRILYPPRVNDMNSLMNLLHHYAWEESNFPQKWVNDFNTYLQGVTCLSRHVEKVMIDSGVAIPLSVSGCGVDHWERIVPDTSYEVEGNIFKFLHVSSCFPRKGIDCLLEAYGKAFTSEDNVTLVIKTFPNPHNIVHEDLLKVRNKYSNYPDVIIIEQNITDSELKSLYKSCDVLVAPSKAEGFGLPLAEAMLSGLPVITTGWSGQLDFCNEDTSWLVDYSFDYAKTHFNLLDSVWAEPDINDLALKMHEFYELPSEKRIEKANNGRELLMKQFKWSDVAERLVESAKKFATQQEEPLLRIGWISTWNTPCGIAKYSEHIINSFDKPINAIISNHTSALNSPDQPNVYRCWYSSDRDSLSNAELIIDELNLNTIVIQVNYGLFNFHCLSAFIIKQVKAHRVVIVTLHSTKDPEHEPGLRLIDLKEGLTSCHRVLVHSPNDMNVLKNYGIVDNVTLFPHGIADIQPVKVNLKTSPTSFVIASYGFFLPHKGIIELVKSIPILLDRGFKVHLLLVNARYPISISEQIINHAKVIIQDYNIAEHVTMVTEFLDDAESMGYLNNADLIVFPYQKTGESSSAAVRGGLASKKPVAVTPLPIFDDVSSVVYYLPGMSSEDIAQGIGSFIESVEVRDSWLEKMQDNANSWRHEHSYSLITKRLQGMLIGLNRKV